MKIRKISPIQAVVVVDATRSNGQQVTRKASAKWRGGMWHLQPVPGHDFTYSGTSLDNIAEYWENDLRKDRKPWKI